jgi:DNA polymerase-1
MSNYVFDIETNGLLTECSRMWILTTYDRNTRSYKSYLENDFSWMDIFNNAKSVIGHHILGYDLAVLKKLFNYELPKHVKVRDTLIMSQVLDYRRFGTDGHSLEQWGAFLGKPKVEHSNWSEFSPEMVNRNIVDVEINNEVYDVLLQEYHTLQSKAPMLDHYLRAEHAAAKWTADANLHGWPFDLDAAGDLFKKLDSKMQEAYLALSQRLGTKTVPVDKEKGVVISKRPKWLKQGCYDAHTANWFNIDPWSGFEGEARLVDGPYSRITFEPLSLDSVYDVKIFLFRNGWVPTEYNTKIDPLTNKRVKTSPKITEDSLEFLGGDGKLYTEFLTAKSRHSILKTWLANTDDKGNLHGDCMVIGTPSMRSRHSIIVNVPSTDSVWGPEMRALFKTLPGWSLIGCDSAGNQARGLAHYLGDADFINTLLHGDIHQYNADILTELVRRIDGVSRDFIVKRSQAKRILYAFLFGASGAKLWSYIFGVLEEGRGKKLRLGFIKAVPGFKSLLEKLDTIYSKTSQSGDGYIPSIAGNRIYVDSYHKLLVYLLQATEKITCSTALMLTVNKLEEENIPYIPCIFYHDEIDFMVPDEYAIRAAEIGKNSFKEGPKLYNINIMDGDAKIGKTWFDVH